VRSTAASSWRHVVALCTSRATAASSSGAKAAEKAVAVREEVIGLSGSRIGQQ
jgi:hypothetical protein